MLGQWAEKSNYSAGVIRKQWPVLLACFRDLRDLSRRLVLFSLPKSSLFDEDEQREPRLGFLGRVLIIGTDSCRRLVRFTSKSSAKADILVRQLCARSGHHN